MIFYGWGRKVLPLAEIGHAPCQKCGETRPFRLLLNYTYMHLYWIFGLVLRRRYLVACSVCSQGFWIKKEEAKRTAPKDPIPFMQTWGLAILLLGIITVVWVK